MTSVLHMHAPPPPSLVNAGRPWLLTWVSYLTLWGFFCLTESLKTSKQVHVCMFICVHEGCLLIVPWNICERTHICMRAGRMLTISAVFTRTCVYICIRVCTGRMFTISAVCDQVTNTFIMRLRTDSLLTLCARIFCVLPVLSSPPWSGGSEGQLPFLLEGPLCGQDQGLEPA